MRKQTYYYVASGVFLIAAVLHLIRIFNGWDLVLGPALIPVWVSWVVVVLAGYLCIRGFNYGRRL